MSGLTKKDDQARFSIELGANKRSSILRSFSVSVMRSQSPSEVDVPKIPFLLCIALTTDQNTEIVRFFGFPNDLRFEVELQSEP